MHTVHAYTRVGVFSRSEQNEHARLCGVGVPPGAAGGEDRGTHHLLQPQRDEVDEGRQQCREEEGHRDTHRVDLSTVSQMCNSFTFGCYLVLRVVPFVT